MKQLELNLNKRLLIVESENFDESQLDEKHKITLFHNGNVLKFICKGSEFTEDIVKEFLHQSIHTGLFAHYVKGIPVNTYCYKTTLESFISAIESKGWFWGENPFEKEVDLLVEDNSANGCAKYRKAFNEWQEAESRTFTPDKCIIFEIL